METRVEENGPGYEKLFFSKLVSDIHDKTKDSDVSHEVLSEDVSSFVKNH